VLRIFVVSHNGSPPATPVSALFGNGEGSIGRDPTNTLVLTESDKHLSRVQALIKCLGGEYFLLDQGGNPTIVNGRPVGKGKVATLHPGDKIHMAGWVMQVAPRAPVAAAPAPTSALAPAPVPAERRPLPPEVADFLGKGPAKPPKPAAEPPVSPEFAGGNTELGTATVLMPELAGQSLDPRSWGSPSDFLRDFLQDAIVSDTPDEKADTLPEDPSGKTDAAALQAALLRGLGITAMADWQLTAGQAELLGAMLRASMEGFQRLLKENALSRRGFQSATDAPESDVRNPIKTSADAEIALHRMLFQSSTGSTLPPVAAVQDVILELHAHHAGFSLGMRGAMAGMLTSFKPEVLEKRLVAGSVVSEAESNLWELYVRSHTEIARKAENIFHSTLALAYRRVYEDQKSRHAAGRTSSG
jgi:type VI secretion system FHA domain protein